MRPPLVTEQFAADRLAIELWEASLGEVQQLTQEGREGIRRVAAVVEEDVRPDGRVDVPLHRADALLRDIGEGGEQAVAA